MRPRWLLALVAGLAILAGACGSDDDPAVGSSASTDVEHNDADVEFATGMIPHHAQAIEMADMALHNAESAEVKTLAEEIKAAQQPEIDMLTEWLDGWGEEVPAATGGTDHDAMVDSSMMSEDDMSSLESATGAELDRMFLEMMIEHHQGAIDMAETEIDEGQFPEAIEMAERIVESQQAEIDEMKRMLDTM